MKSSTVTVDELVPRRRKLVLCFATVLTMYCAAMICSTHIPEDYFPFRLPPEELLHFTSYACLTILILATLGVMGRLSAAGIWCWVGVWLLVGLIGMVDELTQPWFGRSFKWKDWFADLAGAFFSIVLIQSILLTRKLRVRH